MESAILKLAQLEERSKLWQKYYEEEEKRIEDEYDRGLADIERAYKEAAKKIQLNFLARKEAIKREYYAKDEIETKTVKSSSKCTSPDSTSPKVVSDQPSSTSKPNSFDDVERNKSHVISVERT